jgi:hypothetical protein
VVGLRFNMRYAASAPELAMANVWRARHPRRLV